MTSADGGMQQLHCEHLAPLSHCLLQIPTEYPHWMEKKGRKMYESTTVLGKMYDRVMQHPLTKHLMENVPGSCGNNLTSTTANSSSSSQPQNGYLTSGSARDHSRAVTWPGDLLLRVPGIAPAYRQLLELAEAHFIEFESDMVGLMNHWEVYNVGECVILDMHDIVLQHV